MADINTHSDLYNKLEDMIGQVLVKKGVLNNYHEIGIVEKQISSNLLLVAPLQFEKQSEEIPCAETNDGYRRGDRVLIEYINGSPHHKFVMCVISKGAENANIDYNNLKDTPFRIFRRKVWLGPRCEFYHDVHHDLMPLAYKVLYDEGSTLQWWEIYNRDEQGRIRSVTTYWPPEGQIRFTNFVVRDSEGLLHYYGPDGGTSVQSDPTTV